MRQLHRAWRDAGLSPTAAYRCHYVVHGAPLEALWVIALSAGVGCGELLG